MAQTRLNRREFLHAAAGAAVMSGCAGLSPAHERRPNLVYIFADQWRAQATGYAGDSNVHTPIVDRLAKECVNLVNAVSGCPVCSPYRGSLMTGQYPLQHGVFVNDVPLGNEAVSFGQSLRSAGYQTAYIGKWHIDGHGRSAFIPEERRQGFDYWKVLECTHNYNDSAYYADDPLKRTWDGYDAIAQTRDAVQYVRDHASRGPFALFLSWGPPHNPYETAPEEFKALYDPEALQLRPNVPRDVESPSRKDLAGYYAHCTTLDSCVGELLAAVDQAEIADDTIFVFTSDHGDMLGSQGEKRKQRPWDESIRVPFLIRYPSGLGRTGREDSLLINTRDIMPTMLGLCGLESPASATGSNYSGLLRGGNGRRPDAALLMCPHPFGEWTRAMGGREYRGVRTERHTYVRALDGPWLLYDNVEDPVQLKSRCGSPDFKRTQDDLDEILRGLLAQAGDEFLPGDEYIKQWGYTVDANGTVPYAP